MVSRVDLDLEHVLLLTELRIYLLQVGDGRFVFLYLAAQLLLTLLQ